jgi:hypothetical protein
VQEGNEGWALLFPWRPNSFWTPDRATRDAHRKDPQWRWLSWGSPLAALLLSLFSWDAGNLGNYDKTYGSLGAAVGLMP